MDIADSPDGLQAGYFLEALGDLIQLGVGGGVKIKLSGEGHDMARTPLPAFG
ncbi:MAG: hypothetical protein ACRED5_21390 [Propylenella sp.]